MCTLSLPAEFFDTISKLAQGKVGETTEEEDEKRFTLTLSPHQWPPPILPMAPSVSGSAFSLGGSSLNSRPPSVADSRGFSPTFDDEMDLGMADSGPSVQSEPSGTNMIGNVGLKTSFSAHCLSSLSQPIVSAHCLSSLSLSAEL